MPTPKDTGSRCLQCKIGQIIETQLFIPQGEWRIGGTTPGTTVTNYHCNCCGAMYRFCPPTEIVRPQEVEGQIQVAPGLMATPQQTIEEIRQEEYLERSGGLSHLLAIRREKESKT